MGPAVIDLSLLPASASIVAILGIRRKQVWGPIVAIWASLAWIVYGGVTDQIGIVVSELVIGALYVSTMLKWMQDEQRS